MPAIYVCALSCIDATVTAVEARSLITLIHSSTLVQRPSAIAPQQHLCLSMSDIVAPMDGHVLPDRAHVAALLVFVAAWDRRAPLVIHCYAGVSRSTAAAFIAVCALDPRRSEREVADQIRLLSPTATPNARLVAVADEMLGRCGRMVAAVAAIGRGADCFVGVPFMLDVPA